MTTSSSFGSGNKGWVGPKATPNAPVVEDPSVTKNQPQIKQQQEEEAADAEKYHALVVDSGAIIKHSAFSTLHNAAASYFTVPAVLDEIRDAKARQHLDNLPFELQTRLPSAEAMKAVSDFSRLTGDYRSLSSVDMQVLALLYDLEVEGCNGDKSHIRTTPKRTLGVGHIQSLTKEEGKQGQPIEEECKHSETDVLGADAATGTSFFETSPLAKELDTEVDLAATAPSPHNEGGSNVVAASNTNADSSRTPKSWAMLVNPTAASSLPPSVAIDKKPGKIVQFGDVSTAEELSFAGGQFDDASEDDEDAASDSESQSDDDDDEERYANISDPDDISDEECDVYILDPEEVEERKRRKEQVSDHATSQDTVNEMDDKRSDLSDELSQAFPSLTASLAIPYEGSDEEEEKEIGSFGMSALRLAQADAERNRQESLKPITKTKDGKMYNSFRKYGHVVASTGIAGRKKGGTEEKAANVTEKVMTTVSESPLDNSASAITEDRRKDQSRIIGGDMSMAGKMTEEDDDGEGWITNTSDIRIMKSSGRLDPSRDPAKEKEGLDGAPKRPAGPPLSQRTACATTDFAMQNVILQMNLSLLTVDGVKVRRLKSWVTRCGACFTIYTGDANGLGSTRLFCERCGSDFMQRIAASVDGKTGRLKLHLSKKYKNNTRGTKFSLPAPGKGNRFEGDLLLREDQLMMGAWNQKARKATGKKEAQSIFGSDIAANVGCHADLTKSDNIKVGFGRRNPNASKFGRERRGKKKKSKDTKACGLRRY